MNNTTDHTPTENKRPTNGERVGFALHGRRVSQTLGTVVRDNEPSNRILVLWDGQGEPVQINADKLIVVR